MQPLDISVTGAPPAAVEAGLLVLPWFEGEQEPAGAAAELDTRLAGAIGRVLRAGDFRGSKDETAVLYPRAGEIGAERVLLVGLGKRDGFGTERLRRALGCAVRQAQRLGAATLAVLVPRGGVAGDVEALARAAAEGAVLAAWQFRELRTRPSEEAPRVEIGAVVLVAADGSGAQELEHGARIGAAGARGENLARELAARPSNLATPTYLAGVAEELGHAHGLTVTVLDRAAIEAEGMGALLAVARGTEEEPRFIVLEYRRGPEDAAPLVLIGKGVTFDSGGISL